ncbi:C4-dicarboxylate transport system permease large protein [Shouchella clausii KSM-K16]|uniref:C4-dicarboxylate transport system permease large protein n=1 Tax=Shouchella clausii (strain KSM-K16) TaxID=66692 RepID=Q5WIZ1_SHOC1|nr:TRAP transporter large permease [Shouchella clausii]BAD63664.1 C4-dicarboxylate transport system permease large protein [Shouchella clausii KSM-K16]
MMLLLIVSVIVLLIVLNVPVAYAMLAGVAIYFIVNPSFMNETLTQRVVSGVESFPLLGIVFFITAGVLMNYTGITKRMLVFAKLVTGHLTGGLAKVNVLLSVLMGGLSGSNVADAAMQSKIVVPEMVKKGYAPGFSAALTATSSLITPILPPGIALILYGYVGNVSIGDLFIAGIIPGFLLAAILLVYVHFAAKKRGFEQEMNPFPSFKQVAIASKDALLALLLPILIIGGIRLGMFGPTEAGAVAVLYALVIGLFIYREMTFKDLVSAAKESVQIIATVMIIIAAGTAFGWMLTLEQVPQQLASAMTTSVEQPLAFLVLLLVFLLIVGMFIEGNVMLIILTPIFMPMLETYGIDPVHFGIFFILCLSIGTITPPIGTIMFTTASITKVKIETFIKEVIPFWLLLIGLTLIIIFIPALSLWLPSVLS